MVNYLGKYTSSSHGGYGTIGFPRDFVFFHLENVFFSGLFVPFGSVCEFTLSLARPTNGRSPPALLGGRPCYRRVAAVVEGRHREHTLFLLAPAEICGFWRSKHVCVLLVVVVVVDTNNLSQKSDIDLLRINSIWVFPKIVVPQNGWFIMENPIKMDDLGVPLFSETSICGYTDLIPITVSYYFRYIMNKAPS